MKKNEKMTYESNGSVTKYIYSATGEKLRVIHQTAVPNISVPVGFIRPLASSEILSADSTDYYPSGLRLCDGTADSGTQPYMYNFSIERGKSKLAYSSEREKNRPKVNGKELDRLNGLDLYDYGARHMDGALGRFTTMDPLCEKYYSISPYAYCANNPVNAIDPDGERKFNVIGPNGWVYQTEIQDNVQGTFDIDYTDYGLLYFAFLNDLTKEKKEYNNYFNMLAIGTKGYDIASTARIIENSNLGINYGYHEKLDNAFTEGKNKCNKFVYDVLYKNEVITECQPGCPPIASRYTQEPCPFNGYYVETDHYSPRLGDIIAGAYNFQDASGHVEIVTRIYPKFFGYVFETTGAHEYGVYTSDAGFKMLKGTSNTKYKNISISRPK